MVITIGKGKRDPIVGERLKELRENIGLTQKQVAEAVCLSVSTIKHYECGYRIPDEDNLNALASFYKVYPSYILGTTPFKTPLEETLDRWNETIDTKKLTAELQFIESAEALGFLDRSADDPEGDYEKYIAYNRLYQERKAMMKTRSDIKVVTGAKENQIIYSFVTDEITIQVKTEADVETGFLKLIERGIVLKLQCKKNLDNKKIPYEGFCIGDFDIVLNSVLTST